METKIFTNRVRNLSFQKGKRLNGNFLPKIALMLTMLLAVGNLKAQPFKFQAVGSGGTFPTTDFASCGATGYISTFSIADWADGKFRIFDNGTNMSVNGWTTLNGVKYVVDNGDALQIVPANGTGKTYHIYVDKVNKEVSVSTSNFDSRCSSPDYEIKCPNITSSDPFIVFKGQKSEPRIFNISAKDITCGGNFSVNTASTNTGFQFAEGTGAGLTYTSSLPLDVTCAKVTAKSGSTVVGQDMSVIFDATSASAGVITSNSVRYTAATGLGLTPAYKDGCTLTGKVLEVTSSSCPLTITAEIEDEKIETITLSGNYTDPNRYYTLKVTNPAYFQISLDGNTWSSTTTGILTPQAQAHSSGVGFTSVTETVYVRFDATSISVADTKTAVISVQTTGNTSSLTISDDICSVTGNTVLPTGVSISSNPLCVAPGESVTLTAVLTGGLTGKETDITSYTWLRNGSSAPGSSNSSTYTFTPSSSDFGIPYKVQITGNGGINEESSGFTLCARTATVSGVLEVCSAAPADLTVVTNPVITPDAVQWKVGLTSNTDYSTWQNVASNALVPNNPGESYIAEITYSSGTFYSSPVTVTAIPAPASLSINPSSVGSLICPGKSVDFERDNSHGAGFTYGEWKVNGASTGNTSANYTFTVPTTPLASYTISVTVTNGCPSDTKTATVTVTSQLDPDECMECNPVYLEETFDRENTCILKTNLPAFIVPLAPSASYDIQSVGTSTNNSGNACAFYYNHIQGLSAANPTCTADPTYPTWTRRSRDILKIQATAPAGNYKITFQVCNVSGGYLVTLFANSAQVWSKSASGQSWDDITIPVNETQLSTGITLSLCGLEYSGTSLIGIDNIKIIKDCPPTFKIFPPTGDCTSGYTIEAKGTSGYNLASATSRVWTVNYGSGFQSSTLSNTVSSNYITNNDVFPSSTTGVAVYRLTVTGANGVSDYRDVILDCRTVEVSGGAICGTSASGTLTADVSHEGSTYQWQANTGSAGAYENITSNGTSSTLAITSSDAGKSFRVVITAAGVSKESDPVTVTTGLAGIASASLVAAPVCAGEDLTLIATLSALNGNLPAGSYTAEWYINTVKTCETTLTANGTTASETLTYNTPLNGLTSAYVIFTGCGGSEVRADLGDVVPDDYTSTTGCGGGGSTEECTTTTLNNTTACTSANIDNTKLTALGFSRPGTDGYYCNSSDYIEFYGQNGTPRVYKQIVVTTTGTYKFTIETDNNPSTSLFLWNSDLSSVIEEVAIASNTATITRELTAGTYQVGVQLRYPSTSLQNIRIKTLTVCINAGPPPPPATLAITCPTSNADLGATTIGTPLSSNAFTLTRTNFVANGVTRVTVAPTNTTDFDVCVGSTCGSTADVLLTDFVGCSAVEITLKLKATAVTTGQASSGLIATAYAGTAQKATATSTTCVTGTVYAITVNNDNLTGFSSCAAANSTSDPQTIQVTGFNLTVGIYVTALPAGFEYSINNGGAWITDVSGSGANSLPAASSNTPLLVRLNSGALGIGVGTLPTQTLTLTSGDATKNITLSGEFTGAVFTGTTTPVAFGETCSGAPFARQAFLVKGSCIATNIALAKQDGFEIYDALTDGAVVTSVLASVANTTGVTLYLARTGAGDFDETAVNLTGGITTSITASGTVNIPSITPAPTSITSGLNYSVGTADPPTVKVTLDRVCSDGNLTISAPTDFEVSLTNDPVEFKTSITLSGNEFWVRMVSGLNLDDQRSGYIAIGEIINGVYVEGKVIACVAEQKFKINFENALSSYSDYFTPSTANNLYNTDGSVWPTSGWTYYAVTDGTPVYSNDLTGSCGFAQCTGKIPGSDGRYFLYAGWQTSSPLTKDVFSIKYSEAEEGVFYLLSMRVAEAFAYCWTDKGLVSTIRKKGTTESWDVVSGYYSGDWVNTSWTTIKMIVTASELTNISTNGIVFEVVGHGSSRVIFDDITLSVICPPTSNNYYVRELAPAGGNGTSWGKAFQTVEDALDAVQIYQQFNPSVPQANVYVAEGTYTAPAAGYPVRSDVTIYGGYPVNAHTLEASGAEIVRNPVRPTGAGGTLTTGNETKFIQNSNSSGIINVSAGITNLEIRGVRFGQFNTGTNLTTSGAALYMTGGSVTLDSCWIEGFNDVINNNGRYAAMVAENGNLIIKNTTISNNQAQRNAGLAVIGNPTVKIYNSTFANNRTNWGGGAILLRGSAVTSATVDVYNSTFFNNTGEYDSYRAIRFEDTAESGPLVNCYNVTMEERNNANWYGTKLKFYNSIVRDLDDIASPSVNNNYNPKNADQTSFRDLFVGGTLQSCNGFTQVLIPIKDDPTVIATIMNSPAQAQMTETDQCGNTRNPDAFTRGAYEIIPDPIIESVTPASLTFRKCTEDVGFATQKFTVVGAAINEGGISITSNVIGLTLSCANCTSSDGGVTVTIPKASAGNGVPNEISVSYTGQATSGVITCKAVGGEVGESTKPINVKIEVIDAPMLIANFDGSLIGFASTVSNPSAPLAIEVTGACAESDCISDWIAVSTTGKYEVSTSPEGEYVSTLSIQAGDEIYVRLKNGAVSPTNPGEIILTSNGIGTSTTLVLAGVISADPVGTTYYFTGTGSWTTGGTWYTVSCSGTQTTDRPGADDPLVICEGGNLTVDTDATCKSVTIRNQNSASSLTISGAALRVKGNIALEGTNATQSITVDGGVLEAKSIELSNSSNNNSPFNVKNSSSVYVNGNLRLTGTKYSSVALSGGSNMWVTGNVYVNTGETSSIAISGSNLIITGDLTLEGGKANYVTLSSTSSLWVNNVFVRAVEAASLNCGNNDVTSTVYVSGNMILGDATNRGLIEGSGKVIIAGDFSFEKGTNGHWAGSSITLEMATCGKNIHINGLGYGASITNFIHAHECSGTYQKTGGDPLNVSGTYYANCSDGVTGSAFGTNNSFSSSKLGGTCGAPSFTGYPKYSTGSTDPGTVEPVEVSVTTPVYAMEGENAEIKVSIEPDVAGAIYELYKDGSLVATSAHPTIAYRIKTTADHGDDYTVRVTGTATGESGEFTIAEREVTLDASPTVICALGTATLTATLEGFTDCGMIQWEKESAPDVWDALENGDWAYLTIPATFNVTSAGNYRATVKETSTGKPVSSDPVNITEGASNFLWIGENSSDWDDYLNWQPCDATGKNAQANTKQVWPSPCDNVFISTGGDHLPRLGTPAAPEKFTCNNIYFAPGASVGQIHNLTYNTASADMRIISTRIAPTEVVRWFMLTSPFKGIKSIDYKAPSPYVSYIRYFEVNGGAASWTAVLPNTDISLYAGQGFVYRATTMPVLMPGTDTSLDIPFSGRFITEEEEDESMQFDSNGEYSISFQTGSGGGSSVYGTEFGNYLMIGNPFMSHLDVSEFLDYNIGKEIVSEKNAKVYHNTGTGAGSFQSVQTGYVAPFQSFIVSPKDYNDNMNFKFTAAMLGTDVGTPLRGLSEPDNTLRIRATQNGYTSLDAVVIAKDGATNAFDPNEDATKLFSKESPLEVTTMIDGMDCDINRLNRDMLNELSVPINIKSTKSGTITLEIDGAIGFTAADNIYFYDNQTRVSISLLEKGTFVIDKEDTEDINGRYFLQFIKEEEGQPTYIDDSALSQLYIGTRQSDVVVEARGEEILQVTVFDVTGRKVLEAGNINSTSYRQSLPGDATYLVRVVTSKQVKTGKIIIK